MSGATELITIISVMRNVCRDALRWSANLDGETRDQEAMIRPTVICSRHGSCDRHLFSVFCSCKDIVEQTPEHCCKHFKTIHVILSLLDGFAFIRERDQTRSDTHNTCRLMLQNFVFMKLFKIVLLIFVYVTMILVTYIKFARCDVPFIVASTEY